MSRRRSDQQFTSTEAKDYIRYSIDRNLIRRFREQRYPDEKLAYFGLPGEAILDILSWREFIGYVTAVEDDGDRVAILERNILKNHLEGMTEILQCNIDNLLMERNGESIHRPYQIVNLDYEGGLVYPGHQRIESMKMLFSKQRGTAFLFLLTLNLRDKDENDELERLVCQQEDDLHLVDPEGVRAVFSSHLSLGHAGLLKVHVPIFLLNEAKYHDLKFVSPILYQGTRQMIHFVVECTPDTSFGAGRVVSIGDRVAGINRPLLTLHGDDELRSVDLGRIQPASSDDEERAPS